MADQPHSEALFCLQNPEEAFKGAGISPSI